MPFKANPAQDLEVLSSYTDTFDSGAGTAVLLEGT